MIYHVYKWSYLGQFGAQTIGTRWTIGSTRNSTMAYGYKKIMFPWQLTFSSPYPHDFNMLVVFRSKNIKRGRELEQNIFICFLDRAYEAP